jgi:hypothetical protein
LTINNRFISKGSVKSELKTVEDMKTKNKIL